MRGVKGTKQQTELAVGDLRSLALDPFLWLGLGDRSRIDEAEVLLDEQIEESAQRARG